MKYAPSVPNIDRRLYGLLLLPSWLSGSLTTLIGLGFCIGTIFLARYQSSSVRLYFINYRADQLSGTYHHLSNTLLGNSFVGNLPLLVFWGLVGLVVYMFAANLVSTARHAAELKKELNYVHANRHSILWRPVELLSVRLVVLGVWALYIMVFFQQILPYCVAASIVGAGQFNAVYDSLYALTAVVIMIVALHLHVVLLRMLLLKPRLFSRALYADLK